jgi:hypothetical protein
MRTLISPDKIDRTKFEGLRLHESATSGYLALLFSDDTACVFCSSSGFDAGESVIEESPDIDGFSIDEQFALGLISNQERVGLLAAQERDRQERKAKEQQRVEASERSEYARLRKKFEGTIV